MNYGESNILRNIFIFIFRLRQTEVCYYREPDLVNVVTGESVLRHIAYLPPGGVSLMIQDGILERILFSFSINRTIMVTILHNKLIRSINN